MAKKKQAAQPPPPSSPLEVVRRTLEGLQLKPQKIGGVDGYVIDLDDALFEGALAQVLSEEHRFVFYIDFRKKASKAARGDVIEYLARANNGIIIGNFEIDLQDGIIRYKTSIDFQDDELSEALVRNAIGAAHDAVRFFGRELDNVMRRRKSPAAAIADAERTAS